MTRADATSLRAICVPLATGEDRPTDPLALAGDRGHLFVGRYRTVAGQGSAAVLDLPGGQDDPASRRALRAWLAAVPVDVVGDDDGDWAQVAVVALGALPFDRAAPGALVVPARAWCRAADGRSWLVSVGPATGDTDQVAAGLRAWFEEGRSRPPAEPGELVVEDAAFLPPAPDYAGAVADAVGAIVAGRMTKVVLARAVDVHFARRGAPRADRCDGPAATDVLRRLWAGDPSFSAFSIPVANGTFVGASPELIVARLGTDVRSHPLAGTVALPAGPANGARPAAGGPIESARAERAIARLLGSMKDLAEHRLVVDDVIAGLAAHCVDIEVPDHPTVVRLRSDARLGTLVRARVPGPADHHDGGDDRPDRDCDALALLAELHPTPAVGGVDRKTALAWIAAAEPVPRGYWAGTVGWIDGSGDGEWVLGIRSALLQGSRARVHAGAGIVAGSDPDLELAETTTKLAPVLDALVPGGSALLHPLTAERTPHDGPARGGSQAPSAPGR